jgi:hypothetical protein
MAGEFGPFRPGIDPIERIAQLRSLAAFAHVYAGRNPVVEKLRAAESGEPHALTDALRCLDTMPALKRRHILAAFAALHRPVPADILEKPEGRQRTELS